MRVMACIKDFIALLNPDRQFVNCFTTCSGNPENTSSEEMFQFCTGKPAEVFSLLSPRNQVRIRWIFSVSSQQKCSLALSMHSALSN